MSKTEIRKILKSLYELEDIRYFQEEYNKLVEDVNANLNEIQSRVQDTLKLSVKSQQDYICYINSLYDEMSESNNQEAVKWLTNNKELLEKTLETLDEVLRLWPEFTQREDVNGKDTQI